MTEKIPEELKQALQNEDEDIFESAIAHLKNLKYEMENPEKNKWQEPKVKELREKLNGKTKTA